MRLAQSSARFLVVTPLVSVIIPCYNAERWLAATLDSALAQTWTVLEIIVVNDGSHDGSLRLARRFEARGVRILDQPNRGASATRNAGLRVARGEFIQFLDADDLLTPEKIARQVALLSTAARGSIAAGPWGRFETDPVAAVFVPEENWRDCDPVTWLILNFRGRGMMPPAAWLTPRAIVERAGSWDERLTLNDDGEFFCRALLASAGVRFCRDARTLYRSNVPCSLSGRHTSAAWRSALLSQQLCAQHLLARENTPRTRAACADLLRRLAFAVWRDDHALAAECEAEARAYGGSKLLPEGGRLHQLVARTLGWRTAQSFRGWRQRVR